MIQSLEKRIDIAMGRREADLVIRNAHIFHLTTGDFEDADIAIADGMIAGIGHDYHGREEFDAHGLTAVPGFIDSHVHLESSLLIPAYYERIVTRRGVTTAVCDPHEMANVLGLKAFDFFYEAASHLTMDIRIGLSSCVPATPLETAGAVISAADLQTLHERYPDAHLAELMNVPGVLNKDPEVLTKVSQAKAIDGHCPLLSGRELNAYVSVGVRNDHETTSLEEGREKLRRGLQVLIRQGSASRNLEALLPLITVENSPFLAFCTDDRNPLDMSDFGHIDTMITAAIADGCSPLAVYRAATLSAANSFGLWDRGLIAPGKRADIVLLSDLELCEIDTVFCQGQRVCDELFDNKPAMDLTPYMNTIKCREMTAQDFERKPPEPGTPVIGVHDGLLLTDFLRYPVDDIAMISVVERHGRNGNIAHSYVHGFGMKRGAIASSVGHDSHNICVVGMSASDMALAVNTLRNCQGGLAVVIDGKVEDTLPLPIAGLMTDASIEDTVQALRKVRVAAVKTGCRVQSPFMLLSFIPLPVIPFLKLTDKGLVDTQAFKLL